jgi:carbonic anhydrase
MRRLLRTQFGTVGPTGLNVVYGVYFLENRRVWTPQASGMTATGLPAAPRDAAGLMELGDALVRADRIVSLIQT